MKIAQLTVSATHALNTIPDAAKEILFSIKGKYAFFKYQYDDTSSGGFSQTVKSFFREPIPSEHDLEALSEITVLRDPDESFSVTFLREFNAHAQRVTVRAVPADQGNYKLSQLGINLINKVAGCLVRFTAKRDKMEITWRHSTLVSQPMAALEVPLNKFFEGATPDAATLDWLSKIEMMLDTGASPPTQFLFRINEHVKKQASWPFPVNVREPAESGIADIRAKFHEALNHRKKVDEWLVDLAKYLRDERAVVTCRERCEQTPLNDVVAFEYTFLISDLFTDALLTKVRYGQSLGVDVGFKPQTELNVLALVCSFSL